MANRVSPEYELQLDGTPLSALMSSASDDFRAVLHLERTADRLVSVKVLHLEGPLDVRTGAPE